MEEGKKRESLLKVHAKRKDPVNFFSDFDVARRRRLEESIGPVERVPINLDAQHVPVDIPIQHVPIAPVEQVQNNLAVEHGPIDLPVVEQIPINLPPPGEIVVPANLEVPVQQIAMARTFKNQDNVGKLYRELRAYEKEHPQYLDYKIVDKDKAWDEYKLLRTEIENAEPEMKKLLQPRAIAARNAARRAALQMAVKGSSAAPKREAMSQARLDAMAALREARKIAQRQADDAHGLEGFANAAAAEAYVAGNLPNAFKAKPAKLKQWGGYANYEKAGNGAMNLGRPYYIKNGCLVGGPVKFPRVSAGNALIPITGGSDRKMTRCIGTYFNPALSLPRQKILYKIGYWKQI